MVLWHTAVYFFFFYEGGKPRRTARFGSARRAVESSAKHWFSIWQRAEKRKERLLSSSTPPHIFPHPFHTDPLFVPSSLSIDLNVTQPWHGFTRLREEFLHLLRFIPFPRVFLLLLLAILWSLLLLCFSFWFLFSCVVSPSLYMHLMKYEI